MISLMYPWLHKSINFLQKKKKKRKKRTDPRTVVCTVGKYLFYNTVYRTLPEGVKNIDINFKLFCTDVLSSILFHDMNS